MSQKPNQAPKLLRDEWVVGLAVTLAAVLTALSVWVYTQWSSLSDQGRPRPTWQTMPKVISQLADGRMVSVKVNFQLKDAHSAGVIEEHEPAVRAMIQSVGTTMTRTDIKGPQGIERYGQAIRDSVNGYLAEREMDDRVKTVAFDELILMP